MYVEPLVSVADIIERVLVDSAAENQFLEHLRRCRPEHLSSRSEQRDVGFCGVAYILERIGKGRSVEVRPTVCVPRAALQEALHSADLRRHYVEHIGLVPLVHEEDAYRRHTCEDKERRCEEYEVDPCAEVIVLE